MKVLIVGVEQIKKDERYMDDKGWSFRKAFEKLGLKTESFFYKKKGNFVFLEKNKRIKDLWRFHMNKRLIKQVKNSKPDILLILKGETIQPETLWNIRTKTHTLIVNVFPDNPLYMGKFEAIEPCHYFFVKDTYIFSVLKGAGLKNIYYLPQCSDPDVHKPLILNENDKMTYSSNLSLIGSMYPYRLKLIEQVIDFKPAIWGKGWSKIPNKEIIKLYRGKDIRGSQKVKAINGSAISLNPHHPLNDIYGINRRTFDIAACRGFQLANYKADMEKVFKLNEEIICFNTIEELKRLIEYYLRHPDERNQIAEASYKRLLMEHTYYHRAKEIL
ncbi:MAG: glycosyltransferase, partial [Nitrospirae bacterium]|nr:glycosyltransferase [Nitrospirota bacterium]